MDKHIRTYTFDELKMKDLNNHQSITIDEIVESLKLIEDVDNSHYWILTRLNDKRNKAVNKKYIAYTKKIFQKMKNKKMPLCKIRELSITDLDDLSNVIFIEQELSLYEAGYFIKLYDSLYNESLNMCLPIDDTNSDKQKDKFYNDRLSLSVQLRRMGKIEESNELLNISYSKIYTFQSYSQEWKSTKKKLFQNDENFRNSKINNLLSLVVNKVKERLEVRNEEKNEILKATTEKKYYKRLEHFYMLNRTLDNESEILQKSRE